MTSPRRKPIPGAPKPRQKPSFWAPLRPPVKWLGGLVVAAVSASVLAYFSGDLFPQLRCEFQELQRTPADGSRFSVLVGKLSGDSDGRQTRLVVNALANEKGFEHVATCRNLTTDLDTLPGSKAREAAEKTGRDWLTQFSADVLVWGEVSAPDKSLRLHFLTAQHGGDSKAYGLQPQTLELPQSFDEELSSQLVAMALAAVSPATEESGTYLVERLQPLRNKLNRLLQEPPKATTPAQRASLAHSLGIALYTIGDQAGDSSALEEATAAYREALKERTRERVPLDWAVTQNNLGLALSILGERENGTARLDEAVAAYREALKEHTRERVPLQWAGTQNNLGNALQTLGARENGTARLDEALAAYREALKEHTRERVPLDWAATQNNLGNALSTLGERENGTARLDEAVAAYREALKEYTRERVPLDWAMTQNNLGFALQTLGERESGTARLDEAVAAFREALKETTRERVPLQWAMTQNNLGIALRTLGTRENGTARLDEAIAAFREALSVFEQSGATQYAAVCRENLDKTEAMLTERLTQTSKQE